MGVGAGGGGREDTHLTGEILITNNYLVLSPFTTANEKIKLAKDMPILIS